MFATGEEKITFSTSSERSSISLAEREERERGTNSFSDAKIDRERADAVRISKQFALAKSARCFNEPENLHHESLH